MFGRGRFYPGVVIDPKPSFKFDPSDEKALSDFRNLIWYAMRFRLLVCVAKKYLMHRPTVERMNEYAPQHSRIFKEVRLAFSRLSHTNEKLFKMILVAKPSKPFTYTAKNTVRRQAVIADYDDEIDALYAAVQETTQPHISAPTNWTLPSTLMFIRIIVTEVLKREIPDDKDLFESGCDRQAFVLYFRHYSAEFHYLSFSLQATWIRNTLLNALGKTSVADPRVIPSSFVYQHPTILSLASYIMSLSEGPKVSNGVDSSSAKIVIMHALVRKFTADFRQHIASRPSDGEVVLLTGTTGWLGSLILAELLQSDVKRIYAVNRKGSSLPERQSDAFAERGLDYKLLQSEKLRLLEADLTMNKLGLDDQTFEEVSATFAFDI